MCTTGEFVGHTTHSMMVKPTNDKYNPLISFQRGKSDFKISFQPSCIKLENLRWCINSFILGHLTEILVHGGVQ